MLALMRTIRLGLKSLMLHKLRSFLTTLGILIGVAAVSVMLAIGEGASQEQQERIQALGSTNILLRSKKPEASESSSSASPMSATVYGLKYLDAERIGTLPAIERIVPVREASKDVRFGAFYLAGNVIGTTPAYLDVVKMRVEEGRWLTDEDDRRRNNVAILGASACEALFPLSSPLGEAIRVGSDRFVVVGVLERLGRVSGNSGPSVDESVFIPYHTSKDWYGDVNIKRAGGGMQVESIELNEIKMRVRGPDDVVPTANLLREMLAEEHEKGDYELTVPLELLREMEANKRIWKIVLAAVGGLSLLVGGIGIMNVMLATVTERTREIGIRRALGAKRRNIITQFLVETVVLSMTGGLLGVAFGIATPSLITLYADNIKTIVRLEHPLFAFFISAVVGIVFGLYPAVRAANMDPVEALRHE